jgi:hypothetical protein
MESSSLEHSGSAAVSGRKTAEERKELLARTVAN